MIGNNTLVIVLAAGKCSRWLNTKTPDLPDQKHLVPIGNTTLIERTKKQLDDREVPSWLITNENKLAKLWDCVARVPSNTGEHTLDTLLATRGLWDDRVIVLLGDVFYTDRGLNKILSEKEYELRFYGNTHEIFGFTFVKDKYEYVIESCYKVLAKDPGIRSYGKFRDLRWQIRHGSVWPPDNEAEDRKEDPNFCSLKDKTTDVDHIRGYNYLLKAIRRGHLIV